MTMAGPMLWVGTSWKMHKRLAEARAFCDGLRDAPGDPRIRRFVIPPFTVLREVAAMLAGTDVRVGAQDMHWEDEGAWTGEISAPMIADCGASMVEIGHSERRAHFAETDRTVGLKVAAAVRHGLTPLVCVGETRAERDAGRADAVLERQVLAALEFVVGDAPVLLAYEPVWAIGAGGSPATPDYADARHAAIAAVATGALGRAVPCLYGGSVNAGNAADLAACPHVDGLFIGRAAWEVAGYRDILGRVAAIL